MAATSTGMGAGAKEGTPAKAGTGEAKVGGGGGGGGITRSGAGGGESFVRKQPSQNSAKGLFGVPQSGQFTGSMEGISGPAAEP
jgi:hypothetical protein